MFYSIVEFKDQIYISYQRLALKTQNPLKYVGRDKIRSAVGLGEKREDKIKISRTVSKNRPSNITKPIC